MIVDDGQAGPRQGDGRKANMRLEMGGKVSQESGLGIWVAQTDASCRGMQKSDQGLPRSTTSL